MSLAAEKNCCVTVPDSSFALHLCQPFLTLFLTNKILKLYSCLDILIASHWDDLVLFSYLAPLSKISPCEWPKKTDYIRTESTPQNISCVKFKWNLACLVCSAHGNHERKTEKVTLQVAIYVSWKDKKLKKYEDRIWRSSTAGLDIQKNRWEIKTSNNVQAWSWGISALDFSEDHKETRVNWLKTPRWHYHRTVDMRVYSIDSVIAIFPLPLKCFES